MQHSVEQQLFAALGSDSAACAAGVLGLVARALSMRGHAAAAACLQRLVALTGSSGGTASPASPLTDPASSFDSPWM